MSAADQTTVIAASALATVGVLMAVAILRLLTLLRKATDRADLADDRTDGALWQRNAARRHRDEAHNAATHWARRARRAEAELARLRTPDPVDAHAAQTPTDTLVMPTPTLVLTDMDAT